MAVPRATFGASQPALSRQHADFVAVAANEFARWPPWRGLVGNADDSARSPWRRAFQSAQPRDPTRHRAERPSLTLVVGGGPFGDWENPGAYR